MINYEGGAIPEEYQNEYVVDRVEATSTTWMGLTWAVPGATTINTSHSPEGFLPVLCFLQQHSRAGAGWIHRKCRPGCAVALNRAGAPVAGA